MKKLMFAALAALAMVGAANAAATWTFDLSGMTGKKPIAIMDGFNATTVDGASENPVGAGYVAYYIWGIDESSYNTVADSILSGLRAGKTVAQVIADGKLTLLADSKTDKDGYLASVQRDVDTSLYYKDGDADWFSMIAVVLAENDADYVFLKGSNMAASLQKLTAGAIDTKKLRDNTGTASFKFNGWYSLSVPEPTSGMLILLGLAGLALKRKRA